MRSERLSGLGKVTQLISAKSGLKVRPSDHLALLCHGVSLMAGATRWHHISFFEERFLLYFRHTLGLPYSPVTFQSKC